MGWFSRKPSYDALGLPRDLVLPERDTLVADAKLIVDRNLSLDVTASAGVPGAPGGMVIVASPIWEPRDGDVFVRASLLPLRMLDYYYTGAGRKALDRPAVIGKVAGFAEWMVTDRAVAERALGGIEELYVAQAAPLRALDLPYRPHYKLLSLLIADFGRKISAGITFVEFAMSLGLPSDALEQMRSPTDPPLDAIEVAMNRKLDALGAREAEVYAESMSEATR